MAMYDSFIPVNLLTGFLGSGKTTLLQRLLANPEMANTAVLINEFGEIGLDHLLLENVDEETVILQSGCVCCTIRGDLSNAIRDLYNKRERGDVPPFDRLTIETTGLADPAPIVSTLMADPVIRHHFRLGNVITTVDAIHGRMQLEANAESVKQAAVADHLVVTKTDIASAEDTAALIKTLRRINPTSRIHKAADDDLRPDILFRNDIYDPATKAAAVGNWLESEAQETQHDHGHHDVNRHDRAIQAFSVIQEQPMDWTAFGLWLTLLLNRHGENVLRVK
ncbi:MAG: CobW family GTP-binding protein, partial [Alphaproteobacteria bacterium]